MQNTSRLTLKYRLLVAVFVVGHSVAAQAQTVDYGSLTELFGEPVTTAATGKPQKASEAPVDIEIVSDAQIRRMGATSLPEVLNRVPGVMSWQPTRSAADVGVRGQNTSFNSTLLVLVNGRQVYIDSYGYTDWSLIPVQLEEIRQIEIVKGPTTALYGFNAVSGVVNIVTYNPKYDNVSEVGISGGSGDYYRGYGYKTFKLSDRANMRISGSAEGFDEFDPHSKTGFVSQSSFQNARNQKIMGDTLLQLTDKTQLRLEGSYASADGTDVPTTFYGVPSDKTLWSTKGSLTSETDIGLTEASLYTNQFHNTETGVLPSTITNQITVLQLQDLFKVGLDHTFRVQGEYRHNTLESEELIGPGADVSYDVFATGGMWNWALTPELEWTNALRMDYLMLDREGAFSTTTPYTSNSTFDRDITAYSANTGLVWKATNVDTFRASYGRGIQAPSLFSFGANLEAAPGVVFAGKASLDPTIVHNYEIGYDRLLHDIGGKFHSAFFYKQSEHIFALPGTGYVSGSDYVVQADDIGDSNTAGFELGLQGTIGDAWSWDASYVYQNTMDDFTSFAATYPTPVNLHYENTTPHHVVKGHIGYATGPWTTDLYGQVTSNFDAVTYDGTNYSVMGMDGYYATGARVAYSIDDAMTIALSGSDFTQARTASSYGLENERRLFLTLSRRF